MIDFLKAFPSVTKEAYMWEWTVPQIKLALYDNTHIHYLSEEESKSENAIVMDGSTGLNDLGMTIFK